MHAQPVAPSLRGFGLILAAFLALVFGTAMPLLGWLPFSPALLLVAGTIAALALAWPAALRPVYVAWNALGRVLGWVNLRLLLGAVFFVLIWPMGAARRLLGHSLPKRSDPAAASYRKASEGTRTPDHFERPY